jgi:hypothetical protein
VTKQQTINFARSLIKETVLMAEVFDGTIGDGAFRNRVATLFYALRIFRELTGNQPATYLTESEDK